MTPRRISFQTATEMRHLRYDQHLTCAQIAQRFGVSTNAVSLHTKLTKPKPASLHERWTLLLPAMRAEIRIAAGAGPDPQTELHFGEQAPSPLTATG